MDRQLVDRPTFWLPALDASGANISTIHPAASRKLLYNGLVQQLIGTGLAVLDATTMSKEQIESKVKAQFGRSAADYGTSKVHAQGYSLQKLVDLTDPQPTWHVLDIATGGGHTALIFAPHVAHVIASDITPEMLDVAAGLAAERGLTNICTKSPTPTTCRTPMRSFDLVTCRVAAHHFPDIPGFLNETARVLKPNGIFALVDNSVPESEVGSTYINAVEVLRDPGHNRCLSVEEWEQECFASGLLVTFKETTPMALDFDDWTARMRVSAENRIRLKAMILQAPEEAAAVLTPQMQGDRMTFHLERMIMIAHKQ